MCREKSHIRGFRCHHPIKLASNFSIEKNTGQLNGLATLEASWGQFISALFSGNGGFQSTF